MKFAALVSGGKDSVFAICKLIDEGNELVALIYMDSIEEYSDSYMYQTVGSEVVNLFGETMDVPLFVYKTRCQAINKDLEYTFTREDEVEDLYNAIKSTLSLVVFGGISSGAILSTYQKNRVEDICLRLSLKSLAPLWGLDQRELLKSMIDQKIDARIIKIASPIFKRECVGMNLREIYEYLSDISHPYEINFCGEGGEFESIVFDCKHFNKRIEPKKKEIFCHPEEKNREGGVYYIKYSELQIVTKKHNFE